MPNFKTRRTPKIMDSSSKASDSTISVTIVRAESVTQRIYIIEHQLLWLDPKVALLKKRPNDYLRNFATGFDDVKRRFWAIMHLVISDIDGEWDGRLRDNISRKDKNALPSILDPISYSLKSYDRILGITGDVLDPSKNTVKLTTFATSNAMGQLETAFPFKDQPIRLPPRHAPRSRTGDWQRQAVIYSIPLKGDPNRFYGSDAWSPTGFWPTLKLGLMICREALTIMSIMLSSIDSSDTGSKGPLKSNKSMLKDLCIVLKELDDLKFSEKQRRDLLDTLVGVVLAQSKPIPGLLSTLKGLLFDRDRIVSGEHQVNRAQLLEVQAHRRSTNSRQTRITRHNITKEVMRKRTPCFGLANRDREVLQGLLRGLPLLPGIQKVLSTCNNRFRRTN
ncbi:hypothetical protein QBC38DRAFT_547503 [Podospora fimiseda]|uniref:Uncharacterized protein n=1 Tax=Podospora fimiseda TaxID=252190 RepID=A0AAN7GTR6_9PEZI|nr:hypothetical protein QBC38DRAFT_547503 [Podospora fimiseda]